MTFAIMYFGCAYVYLCIVQINKSDMICVVLTLKAALHDVPNSCEPLVRVLKVGLLQGYWHLHAILVSPTYMAILINVLLELSNIQSYSRV